MRLLVTRPEPDAGELKARLEALGHDVLIEPLISIRFEGAEDVDLTGAQALIATSRNGVRALATSRAMHDARSLPLYAVGPGTAAAAKELGFDQVITGPRAARDLVTLIALHAEVNGGPLVYLAGDTVAADIAGELRRLGFSVHEPVVYTTRHADRLTSAAIGELKRGKIGGVLLFSPQTAHIYARLVIFHHLLKEARTIMHYCLSNAVLGELKPLGPVRNAVASRPNLQEMLALLAPGRRESR
ncbi:MAG TPA: uroporphyrinogen-III synthase [Hyphomicrobiaceae bacterium]|nr:uroporphyrinogen-III synthase [Hyphomicrobiaceae bacterium]